MAGITKRKYNTKLSFCAQESLEQIKNEGALNPHEIKEKVTISTLNVQYCLRKLIERRLVIRIPDLSDMRKSKYKAIQNSSISLRFLKPGCLYSLFFIMDNSG